MPTCVCGEVEKLKRRDTTPLAFSSKSVTNKQIENELLVKEQLQKRESCIYFLKALHSLFILEYCMKFFNIKGTNSVLLSLL